MFRNIKWFLYKNNPDKLFSLYFEEEILKIYIIDKLIEFEEIHYLIDIAKKDRRYRTDIIMQLIEDNKLEVTHADELLRWLPFSQLYEKLLDHINNNFSIEEIESLKKIFSTLFLNS